MKKKIIITILIILIILLSYIFINTYIDYLNITNELENETYEADKTETYNEPVEENYNTIQVDDDPSIKIVTEYDENMFKGNKSLIFFWASWCSHCQEEYDVIKTAISDYQNRGFNIYIVSHDYEKDELSTFMKNNELNYEVYFDENRVIRAHFNPEASSVPLTYIIDENAKLIASHDGPITLEELNNLIDENM